MYSNRQSPCVSKKPNEVGAEIPLLSVVVTSDSGHAPDHLREMPLRSRSPDRSGFDTLGTSFLRCNPDRQLGHVL